MMPFQSATDDRTQGCTLPAFAQDYLRIESLLRPSRSGEVRLVGVTPVGLAALSHWGYDGGSLGLQRSPASDRRSLLLC